MTWLVLASNFFVYGLQLFFWYGGDRQTFAEYIALSHQGLERGYYWQLLTYAWVHAEELPLHLFCNLFLIFNLGPSLEEQLGRVGFAVVYAAGVLGAAGLWLVADPIPTHVLGGASGAVFALLLGVAALWPQRREWALVLFVIPWHVRLAILAWTAMTVELVLYWMNWLTMVAHVAHLGGGLAGWLLVRGYRRWAHFDPSESVVPDDSL
jgi:membrane associated rhomboid family serine protease